MAIVWIVTCEWIIELNWTWKPDQSDFCISLEKIACISHKKCPHSFAKILHYISCETFTFSHKSIAFPYKTWCPLTKVLHSPLNSLEKFCIHSQNLLHSLSKILHSPRQFFQKKPCIRLQKLWNTVFPYTTHIISISSWAMEGKTLSFWVIREAWKMNRYEKITSYKSFLWAISFLVNLVHKSNRMIHWLFGLSDSQVQLKPSLVQKMISQ